RDTWSHWFVLAPLFRRSVKKHNKGMRSLPYPQLVHQTRIQPAFSFASFNSTSRRVGTLSLTAMDSFGLMKHGNARSCPKLYSTNKKKKGPAGDRGYQLGVTARIARPRR